jgi:branched-chain amino acid transport system substrate-binding protein
MEDIMQPRQSVQAVVLALVAGLVLAACAPAPSASPAAQPAKEQKPAAAPEKTLVIGAALPLTGGVAPDGNFQREGYELWRDTVNAQGGIDVAGTKYKVDLRFYDYKSDTSTAVKLVEKLVTEDKAEFLFGPFGSGATEAASAVTEKYEIPMLAPSANAPPIYSKGYKYIFGILGPPSTFAEHNLDFVLKATDPKPKTLAIISRNDLFPLSTAKAFETAAKARGLEVPYFEQYPIDTSDLSAPLLGARAKGADLLLGTGYINDLALMAKQAKEQRLSPKLFIQTDGPANSAFVDSLKADANYIVTPAWWAPVVNYKDDTRLFESTPDYAKKFEGKFSHTPGYVAAAATSVGVVLQKAIEQSGSVDPKKVRDALAQTDLRTFYGHIKFNPQGQNIGSAVLTLQILDQKLVVVGPDEAATGKLVYPAPAWDKR